MRLKIEITIINKTVVTAATFSMLKVFYLLINGQYKTTGRINPIIGLIVLPTKVIADPISGTNKAMQQFIVINRKVTIRFWLLLIPFSLKISSSMESLLGIMAIGILAITEKSKAKCATCIILLWSYGSASSIFFVHN